MKHLIYFLSFLLSPTISYADCTLQNELHGQKHFICRAPGTSKDVHVLDFQGGFAETAYYHGYFLRPEIERGILRGVQVRTERAFNELSNKEKETFMLIKNCVIDNYRHSVSNEFKAGLKNLHKGLRDAGGHIEWNAFEETNYMVEFSIFVDAMQRQLEESPTKGKFKVFSSCAPYFVGNSLLKPFKKLAQGLRSLKMGCTGISASATGSTDGALVHGRNFDTGLLGFYEGQQVIVINRQKNGITSVGLGSAGLHYAGGISGINNYGLSVSLHELQTEGTRLRYERGESDIAPYLLHTVLQNARTLNEAIGMIQTRKGFGAWTFFISDSKTDESASIEMSGDTVVVARRQQHAFLGQSNHFLAAATSVEGYEYSLNKTLETRARMTHVNRTVQENWGAIDAQWVINRLSGHYDELVGPRSFGRTTTKVYTAATHVMVPGRQEWWMSVGETYPTNRSHFVGFRLTQDRSNPVQILGVTKAAEDGDKASWYDSMGFYVQAYLSNESDSKSLAGLDQTLKLLQQAQEGSRMNGVFEFPYHFMWARMKVYRAARAILQGDRATAFADLTEAQEKIREITETAYASLHPYEQFQLALWNFRAETLKPQAKTNKNVQHASRVQAQTLLAGLIKKHPQQRELYDLRWSLQQTEQLDIVLDADIRLGTVE
ncbi:C45 family autoproteolytic acyltransferase/hydrolase [Bdellovibrio sp. 22V]|uniref:C45 family autoproteolytic acyltransferase/hydolase n=1 Tax=Bdellovibrio sp. 22V TaxID=3044166 RepID=UPI002542C941|nr:C45 family autoproteolytic acyltransferase/hydolase [Bdellovibrio sp. 22V]WII71016.1 C45 family autoproteolytic acyltransferase/hydrolase [Bdellovibrio sp. 22V]